MDLEQILLDVDEERNNLLNKELADSIIHNTIGTDKFPNIFLSLAENNLLSRKNALQSYLDSIELST
ncbi:MAG: hypothetical protein KC550_05660, partial [Nanoarchaeota archaeon]|nr:hypothetical protein [Nanoarchaeota archaeon]